MTICSSCGYSNTSASTSCHGCPLGRFSVRLQPAPSLHASSVRAADIPTLRFHLVSPMSNWAFLQCDWGHLSCHGSSCDGGRYANSSSSTSCYKCALGRFSVRLGPAPSLHANCVRVDDTPTLQLPHHVMGVHWVAQYDCSQLLLYMQIVWWTILQHFRFHIMSWVSIVARVRLQPPQLPRAYRACVDDTPIRQHQVQLHRVSSAHWGVLQMFLEPDQMLLASHVRVVGIPTLLLPHRVSNVRWGASPVRLGQAPSLHARSVRAVGMPTHRL